MFGKHDPGTLQRFLGRVGKIDQQLAVLETDAGRAVLVLKDDEVAVALDFRMFDEVLADFLEHAEGILRQRNAGEFELLGCIHEWSSFWGLSLEYGRGAPVPVGSAVTL